MIVGLCLGGVKARTYAVNTTKKNSAAMALMHLRVAVGNTKLACRHGRGTRRQQGG